LEVDTIALVRFERKHRKRLPTLKEGHARRPTLKGTCKAAHAEGDMQGGDTLKEGHAERRTVLVSFLRAGIAMVYLQRPWSIP
jgi:hypothetical protein